MEKKEKDKSGERRKPMIGARKQENQDQKPKIWNRNGHNIFLYFKYIRSHEVKNKHNNTFFAFFFL